MTTLNSDAAGRSVTIVGGRGIDDGVGARDDGNARRSLATPPGLPVLGQWAASVEEELETSLEDS
jgi:hypothetical protein